MSATGERQPMKRLEATRSLRSLIKGYYDDLFRTASEGRPSAWLNVGVPCEFFYAMDIFPFYPENYGAACGALKITPQLSAVSEAHGFSADLCSYVRATLGTVFSGEGPYGELPKPTLQVSAMNSCIMIMVWWRAVQRHWEVPTFVVDTPLVRDQSEGINLDYVESELRRMVAWVEGQTGRVLDLERLREVVRLSNEGKEIWSEVLDLRRARPCPITAADIFTHMFPMVALRGTPQYVAHLRALRDEIKQRVDEGFAAVEGERYRLLWDNLPPWFDLKLFDDLAARGVNFVIDTYTQAWGPRYMGPIDEVDPLRSFAAYMGAGFLNVQIGRRYDLLAELVDLYGVDGVVFHSDRSCKPFSLVQVELRRKLQENLGIPGLLLEGDHNDQTLLDRGRAWSQLESFLEVIDGRR
ncbi:MAG TPA: 2-hydroxyacyl-CoA dehydratase family protein [Thermoleophilia bacterium]|nr:2-hydroxyacyl-CoA dehydratase family protein [Thermoleophilia bacterium]